MQGFCFRSVKGMRKAVCPEGSVTRSSSQKVFKDSRVYPEAYINLLERNTLSCFLLVFLLPNLSFGSKMFFKYLWNGHSMSPLCLGGIYITISTLKSVCNSGVVALLASNIQSFIILIDLHTILLWGWKKFHPLCGQIKKPPFEELGRTHDVDTL